ncbi:MAG: cation diffusion facilitator family transporter [Planctomycetota bacterium]
MNSFESLSQDAHRRGQHISLLGVVTNVALAMIKLLAGVLGNSYALIADAVESTADILSSMIVWSGLRIAAAPADERHPYGRGKAESLAGVVVALMLITASIGIAIQAIREILKPHHLPAAFTLWVLIGVIVVKETLFRKVHHVAKDIKSGAVLLDAWHHRSDALTSTAAAIGITIALIGGKGYEPADDWAALFASGVIMVNAILLIRAPLAELMDVRQTILDKDVQTAARSVPGVRGVEKVFCRKSGMTFLIDLHLEVDPELTVRAAHDIAHDVKDAIRRANPSVMDVLIHVEPVGESYRSHRKSESPSADAAPNVN